MLIPQNSADNFLVNIKNGITTTHAFGANYSDKWGTKINITAAYFFNVTDNRDTSTFCANMLLGIVMVKIIMRAVIEQTVITITG